MRGESWGQLGWVSGGEGGGGGSVAVLIRITVDALTTDQLCYRSLPTGLFGFANIGGLRF